MIPKKPCTCMWCCFLERLADPKSPEPIERLKPMACAADKLRRALKRRGLSQETKDRIAALEAKRPV